ncbi:hypothetical protein T310_4013 [Rasamsonia emersonii CBS 393.64]|uniref:Uncharacterized protein n=1 Tax=Rasamsonia emersonii (strain ATCC 16479 / CBS 393.64 / IMI 116815) TaxID=1408163 RepID=A0A0F4YVR7_RASE3|nr:hypothetical protein T310_4013 [Rasamsonia emersonii CBS 393.64]KKA21951.1 hypothetical protein T310_4013 [Rasamsonia emersonii CBS 393.64]
MMITIGDPREAGKTPEQADSGQRTGARQCPAGRSGGLLAARLSGQIINALEVESAVGVPSSNRISMPTSERSVGYNDASPEPYACPLRTS